MVPSGGSFNQSINQTLIIIDDCSNTNHNSSLNPCITRRRRRQVDAAAWLTEDDDLVGDRHRARWPRLREVAPVPATDAPGGG